MGSELLSEAPLLCASADGYGYIATGSMPIGVGSSLKVIYQSIGFH